MAQFLSDSTLMALTQKYFGDLGPAVVARQFAIAKAESGGQADVVNLNPNTRDDSHGLWQINVRPDANPQYRNWNLADPEQNAKAARQIYDSAGGPTPWSTYTTGKYAKYMPAGFSGQGQASMNPQAIQEAKLALARAILGTNATPDQVAKAAAQIGATADGHLTFLGPTGTPVTVQATMGADGHGTFGLADKPAVTGQKTDTGALPVGYSVDAQGQYYRGTQPVDPGEVQAAALAQATTMARAAKEPNFGFQTTKEGDLVTTDPQTGTAKVIAKGFAPAAMSDQEKAAEADRMARNAEGFTGQQNELSRAENARQSDNSLAENGRQSDNTLYAQQRDADLQRATQIYQTQANLIPQMADIQLKSTDAERQILSQGGDFLYRAFHSLGQNSPQGLITQGDLISHMRDQLAQLQMPTAPGATPYAPMRPYSGTSYTPSGAPGFSYTPYSPAAASPGAPVGTTYGTAPTPATPSGPAGFGMGPTPPPDYTDPRQAAAAEPPAPAAAVVPGPATGPMPFVDDAPNSYGYTPPNGSVPASAGFGNVYNPGAGTVLDAAIGKGMRAAGYGFGTPMYANGTPGAAPGTYTLGALAKNSGAHGFVTDRTMVTGDPQTQGTPNPEIINNPTGAPLSVTPMQGQGAPAPSPELAAMKKAIDAKTKVLQHVHDPAIQHALIEEIARNRKVHAYATGTGDGGGDSSGAIAGFQASLGSNNVGPSYGGSTAGASGGSGAWSPSGSFDTFSGSINGGDTSGPARPAGIPANATWNGSGWQWGGANPSYRQPAGFAGVGSGYSNNRAPDGGDIQGYYARLSAQNQAMWAAQNASPPTPVDPEVAAQRGRDLQAQLISAADANLPPALAAIGKNQAIGPRQFDFNLPTLEQYNSLTGEEKNAADAYYRLKYQTPLSDVYQEIKSRYAPGFTGRQARVVGPGI